MIIENTATNLVFVIPIAKIESIMYNYGFGSNCFTTKIFSEFNTTKKQMKRKKKETRLDLNIAKFIVLVIFVICFLIAKDIFTAAMYAVGITVIGTIIVVIGAFYYKMKKNNKEQDTTTQKQNLVIPPPLPIQRKYKERAILTKTETAFFYNLLQVVNRKYMILCKVGLWGIVENIERENWNKISQKHLDFIIYNPEKNTVHLVIELDDYTHEKETSMKRDNEKDEILNDAGIPILRVKVESYYNLDELKYKIEMNMRTD